MQVRRLLEELRVKLQVDDDPWSLADEWPTRREILPEETPDLGQCR